MSRPTKESSQAQSVSQTVEEHPTHTEIEQLAYEIYMESGYAEGREMENWLTAESQLHEKYAKKGAAAKATAS
jgi:Protein of unknown function (DUF2934)